MKPCDGRRPVTREGRILVKAVLITGLAGTLAATPAAHAADCSKPLCRSGETYRAETTPGATFGWCDARTGTYLSHTKRSCEVGWTLDRASGRCIKHNCCAESPVCRPGERYDGGGTRGGRPYGVCVAGSPPGPVAHTLRECAAGFELDTTRGVCRESGCPSSALVPLPVPYVPTHPRPLPSPTIAPPHSMEKLPDLVVRRFALKRWGTCAPHQTVATFEVVVGNVGTAPSPAIAKRPLVQVVDQHGSGWAAGKTLGALAPGASQTLEIPIHYFAADPGHMTGAAPHPFKAIVDPQRLVREQSETNNASSNVVRLAAPSGCPKP